MKKSFVFMVCIATVFFLYGCEKEQSEVKKDNPAIDGAIQFNSTAQGISTKTGYSGDLYTEGDNQYERIDWIADDRVGIISPQISAGQYEYKVTSKKTSDRRSTAEFEYAGEGTAMRWTDDFGTFAFYGMYPYSQNQFSYQSSEAVASFSLPQNQVPFSGSWEGNVYVAKANPAYMFMTAYTDKERTQQDPNPSVTLPFLILPTVLEFTISGADDMKVKSVGLFTDDNDLCGNLSATISDGSYPACTLGNGVKSVSMSAFSNEEYISIPKGKYLTFTFFLSPVVDQTNITFRITMDYNSIESEVTNLLRVSGTPYVFQKHRKYNVTGLVVPNSIKWTIRETTMVTPWNNEDIVDLN